MRAGGFTEDKRGNHNCKAPADAAVGTCAALLAGLVQVQVHADAVAEKDEHRGTNQFTDQNTHTVHNKPPFRFCAGPVKSGAGV